MSADANSDISNAAQDTAQQDAAQSTTTTDVLCEAVGANGRMTLNRPAKMNALNDAMRHAMSDALQAWEKDINIYALITQSVNDGVLCAGGDLKEMAAHAKSDPAAARNSIGFEYQHNWRIEKYTKPHVALVNGMVMGSGAGLTSFCTHIVAGPEYQFAMPECAIGLFPDVGVMSKLAQMPDHVGLYMALTGARIDRADGFALGVVTHCMEPSQFDRIRDALAAADTVDPVIDGLHKAPSENGSLHEHRERIATCFSKDSPLEIVDALKAMAGDTSSKGDATWAAATLETLAVQCPLSLAVSFRHYHDAIQKEVRDVLLTDYRLASRLMVSHNFLEGIRALLIDKDKSPKWEPATLGEIDQAVVDAYFAPLGADELDLPEREVQ